MRDWASSGGGTTIRNAATRGWPAWLRPVLLMTPGYAFIAAVYWALNPPYMQWMAWFWVAYAGLFVLAEWGANIAAIEVDPERISVRRHVRSKEAAMQDVLRVDAHRTPWKYLATHQAAPYTIDVWLTGYRHWRLQYVEPEAGDRLLAAFHGYHKPVWVFPSG